MRGLQAISASLAQGVMETASDITLGVIALASPLHKSSNAVNKVARLSEEVNGSTGSSTYDGIDRQLAGLYTKAVNTAAQLYSRW